MQHLFITSLGVSGGDPSNDIPGGGGTRVVQIRVVRLHQERGRQGVYRFLASRCRRLALS